MHETLLVRGCEVVEYRTPNVEVLDSKFQPYCQECVVSLSKTVTTQRTG